MRNVGTWWRTLRHLKVQQLVGRAVFHLRRPAPDLAPAPARRAAASPWVVAARRAPSLAGEGRLRLLNSDYQLDVQGWDDASVDRLLRYNAHYFDDLAAHDAGARTQWQRALVAQWLAANPPGAGTGWEPYPLSLRIVNWIKWFNSGVIPEPAWLHSLAIQARQVAARTEWHLLGNHLLVNAKALVFAGSFFSGPEAERWLRQGLAILDQQLPEQVLADGGQFELSPMYHALALEDVLDLINVTRAFGTHSGVDWAPTAARMLTWLRCLTHPDGTLARFNDGSPGVAPENAELERYATELGVTAPSPAPGEQLLEASGYARIALDRLLLLLDVARIGPDYLPAHGHADCLSFEMSLGARRVLVNGGTSVYGNSARRQFERGTAAHNTVRVAGENSSEVWGGFRVGRRARPRDLLREPGHIRCAHDGYRHLAGAPLHRRSWRFTPRSLQVSDQVAPGRWPAEARFHLAPGLKFSQRSANTFEVRDESSTLAEVSVTCGEPRIEAASHALQFNQVVPTECLAVTLVQGAADTLWRWQSP
jgi:uncharacterized heparinase superfamily protein